MAPDKRKRKMRVPIAKTVYLLTGSPGTGKTTLLREAIAGIPDGVDGFYTQEIREGGKREGFEICTLRGERAILAHVNIKGPFRVGRYGVDQESLDRVGVTAINCAIEGEKIVVIDEIGKMELLSSSFRQAVLAALKSGQKVLGTIMASYHPFADSIKQHPEVELLELNRDGREEIKIKVLSFVHDI